MIEDFAALGHLNEGAVASGRRLAHDRVAVGAEGGIAGIYRHRAGSPEVASSRISRWFGRPAGTNYEAFLPRLERIADAGSSIWQRQMTLGTTPEFCLRGSGPSNLPPEWSATTVEVERV